MNYKEHLIVGAPLIKFQDKDKIAEIQNGKIYMKTLKWYREHENASGNTIVGDEFEALWPVQEADIIFPELNEIVRLKNDALKTTFSDDFVFCMFSMYANKSFFEYSEEQKNELTSFGDTALLITDRNEFIKRMYAAAKRENIKMYSGFVNYYSAEHNNCDMICSLMEGMQNVAFWKRKKYCLQQEFRFLLHSVNTNEDHYVLDIGNIRDISIALKSNSVLNAKIKKHN